MDLEMQETMVNEPTPRSVALTLTNVTVQSALATSGLKELTLHFRSGCVTGVVCPSEKSGGEALIDVLMGSLKPSTGTVHPEKMPRGVVSYVHTGDIVDHLTVRQNVMFSAEMRIAKPWARAEVIDDTIVECGLVDVQKENAGVLDAESKYRLAVAMERVTNPGVIICENPSSGVAALLSSFAHRHSTTVIVTISDMRWGIVQQCDEVVLLDRGEAAYSGSREDLAPYFTRLGFNFQTQSVCECLMSELLREEALGGERSALANTFVQHRSQTRLEDANLPEADATRSRVNGSTTSNLNVTGLSAPGFFARQAVMLKYRLLGLKMQWRLALGWVCIGALLAVVFGAIYRYQSDTIEGLQNRVGMVFFSLSIVFYYNNTGVEGMFQERQLFLHHRKMGYYSTMTYFILFAASKVISIGFWVGLLVTALYIVGVLPHLTAVTSVFSKLIWTASAHSFFVSCVCYFMPTHTLAEGFLTFVLVYNMLFGGLIINLTTLPSDTFFLDDMSVMRWGYEAILLGELKDVSCGNSYLVQCGFHRDSPSYALKVLQAVTFSCAGVLLLLMTFQGKPRKNVSWTEWLKRSFFCGV
eukprot:PhM_4_TR8270/c0_g1_i1/m.53455/K05681/ABCG2, CD338; ATP-binding cassette, subfamily G (WHITE), member 2